MHGIRTISIYNCKIFRSSKLIFALMFVMVFFREFEAERSLFLPVDANLLASSKRDVLSFATSNELHT